MTERELRDLLRTTELDLDPASEQRAWQIVHSAYHPDRAPRRRRTVRRLLLPAVSLAIAGVIAFSAATLPHHTVAGWLRDAFGVTVRPATAQTDGHLPGGGDLLIEADSGAWLVHANGSRHYLGPYSGAAWSPHSRYIVAWHGNQLAALDLTGKRQWALSTTRPISTARWSPDGYRIALSAGGALRVVAGDGSGEHPLANMTSPIPPAWQPRSDGVHHLTFVTQNGEIQQINADTETRLWRARVAGPVRQLLWSPDGSQLLVVRAHALTAYTPSGRRQANFTSPPGITITQARFVSPRQVALITIGSRGPDSVELIPTPTLTTPRVLYTGLEQLSDLTVSADHQWVLASSPSADQWIFIHIGTPARLLTQSQITAEFQPPGRTTSTFPRLAGWQH